MEIDWAIFFRGFVAGLVAVIGLGVGVKILFTTTDPANNLKKGDLVFRYSLSALFLGGQFILAALLLMRGPPRVGMSQNLSLGFGLIASIFFVSVTVLPFLMKNRKKH